MIIDTTCPHCAQPARSAWSKFIDSDVRRTTCQACGKGIQLDRGPWLLPVQLVGTMAAMALPATWHRVTALFLLFAGLAVAGALRGRYRSNLEPIPF